MKKIIIFILFMFILPMGVKANLFCPTEQIIRYKNLASEINYNYTYVESENDVLFNIKIYNFSKDLYLVEDPSGKIINPNKSLAISEVYLNNYSAGKTYKFNVYTFNASCNDEPVHTFYITLPTFNKYYKREDCKGIENYKLCYKWANINMNEVDFKKTIDDYKKSLIKDEEKKEGINNVNYIWEFYQKYYLIILPSIISVLLVIIVVNAVKKRKKDTFGF